MCGEVGSVCVTRLGHCMCDEVASMCVTRLGQCVWRGWASVCDEVWLVCEEVVSGYMTMMSHCA